MKLNINTNNPGSTTNKTLKSVRLLPIYIIVKEVVNFNKELESSIRKHFHLEFLATRFDSILKMQKPSPRLRNFLLRQEINIHI